jgi:hypothetical protein
MEIRFELAAEPAVKAQIALGAYISIAYTVTHTDSYTGLEGSAIIGLIAIFIRTYKTPPLCQLACAK